MKRVALIVEGQGDVESIPSLLAKTAVAFGSHIVISEPPIRAGEAKKLRRAGELERHLVLAATRANADEIFVIVDLDDGCPVEYSAEFNARADAISHRLGKPVHICFCVREYESWLLADLTTLSEAFPEYEIDVSLFTGNAETIRAAKEALRRACVAKGYKPIRDQLLFTKQMNVFCVGSKSRSFRKIIKMLTGLPYETIADTCINSDQPQAA